MIKSGKSFPIMRTRPDGEEEVFLTAVWVTDQNDEPYALVMAHVERDIRLDKYQDCAGGGYICWREVEGSKLKLTGHDLESTEPLNISPSLWHRSNTQGENSPHPECHGFIKDGVWTVA